MTINDSLPTTQEMEVVNDLLEVKRFIDSLLSELNYNDTAKTWDEINFDKLYGWEFHDSKVEYLATYSVRALIAINKARANKKERK